MDQQLILLLRQHAWAPAAILVMLWFYRALSDDSKFPLSWPVKWSKWKPVVIIALGQAICVTKAIAIDHTMWYVAAEHGVIIAFMALGGVHILKIWWPVEGSEPKWLRYFVLVFGKVAELVPVVVTNVVPDDVPTKPRGMMLDDEGLPTKELPPPPPSKK